MNLALALKDRPPAIQTTILWNRERQPLIIKELCARMRCGGKINYWHPVHIIATPQSFVHQILTSRTSWAYIYSLESCKKSEQNSTGVSGCPLTASFFLSSQFVWFSSNRIKHLRHPVPTSFDFDLVWHRPSSPHLQIGFFALFIKFTSFCARNQ